MALIWKKRGYFWPTFHILLVTREKTQHKNSFGTYLTYTYFARPIDVFTLPVLQKLRIYHVPFLFGVTPSVDSFSRHYGAITK